MSTQTGIQANDELREFFGKCREGKARSKFRLVKVIIVNEELTLDEAKETKGSWKEDWDGFVLPSIDDNEPCYLLYRMDEKDGETYKWLMISWSPDSASIRNKMLYASTKATLKKEFGGGQILDDLYGNVRVSAYSLLNCLLLLVYLLDCAFNVKAPYLLSDEW